MGKTLSKGKIFFEKLFCIFQYFYLQYILSKFQVVRCITTILSQLSIQKSANNASQKWGLNNKQSKVFPGHVVSEGLDIYLSSTFKVELKYKNSAILMTGSRYIGKIFTDT